MDIIKIARRQKLSHINNAKGERTAHLTCMFIGGGGRSREGRCGGEGSVLGNTVLGVGFMCSGLGDRLLTEVSLYALVKGEVAGV